MYMNDVNKKEEIRNIATQHLRKFGIKFRPKKPHSTNKVTKFGKKFFKVPLQNLETETITLKNGQQLVLPKRLHGICTYIISKAYTEGIFRKEGSKSRQNEIKLSLDRGCLLGDEHHVVDVAVILKVFLRELPEPLIPYSYHELFLRCSLLVEKKLDAIYLACLLLPTEHLNILTYLMQFFNEIASFSEYNKMTYSNLAIVVGPNIFPIDEKIQPKSQLMLTKTCDIIKIMIENGDTLGFIPDYIIEEIGNSDSETDKKRKKRRSGSLTRMFSGLKKIVTNRMEEDNNTNIVTPDLLVTPCISRSMKKRRFETGGGLSLKKKKELLNKLPECAVLSTPFTPSRTPISVNPNGKKTNMENETMDSQDIQKEKKLHWYMRSRSMKNLKDEPEKDARSRRSSFGPRAMLERRWSAVSQAANFKKKKTNPTDSTAVPMAKSDSCTGIENKMTGSEPEPDYVRVPKAEYEEIKNRVSAIERRISLELETVESQMTENENNINSEVNDEIAIKQSNIQNVQNAYKQTLEQAETLSPSTDHLARRLSKELRIRRSTEPKIIRSPSARKIGTIRRRSREVEKKNVKINRHQSWHMGVTQANLQSNIPTIPRVSLQRKTSTPIGVEHKLVRRPLTEISLEDVNIQIPYNLRKSSPRIQTSINANSELSHLSKNSKLSCNTSGSSTEHWTSAEGFFSSEKIPGSCSSSDRASIAKIRSQNAGTVLAKARLFDTMKGSDNSSSIKSNGTPKKVVHSKKMGAIRNSEARMSCRVRALRSEDRKSKKSMSPRRRNVLNSSHRQRIQAARRYAEENRINVLATPLRDSNVTTPRSNVPQIKKPLMVRSPKRLCRTPVVDRKTPMKVLVTPRFNI